VSANTILAHSFSVECSESERAILNEASLNHRHADEWKFINIVSPFMNKLIHRLHDRVYTNSSKLKLTISIVLYTVPHRPAVKYIIIIIIISLIL